MDLNQFQKIIQKLGNDLSNSRHTYLADSPILKAKLIDVLNNAQELLPKHKAYFAGILTALLDTTYPFESKEAADVCEDVYNYALMEEKVGNSKLAELDLAKYEKISLAFLDLDNLKKINDKQSHDEGDAAVESVKAVLKDLEDKGFLVFRNYSRGDEFVVALPNVEKAEAAHLIDEYREKIANLLVNNKFNVTVSVGIASYPEDATTREKLIKLADEALHLSKRSGRNCVTAYSENMHKQTENILFTFQGIADIQPGSELLVKSWKCHHPPHFDELEAIEMLDLSKDVEFESASKGAMTTVATITKNIQGTVTTAKRQSHTTLFNMLVNKKQLEGLGS